MNFKDLHQQHEAVIIGNVWDVASACIAEQAGYQIIGTSSAAIATTKGLADGELVSFEALLSIVKDIIRHTSLPLSVDIEGGYSRNPAQIVKHIVALAEAGAKGVNIEDSVVDGERVLLDPYVFSELIGDIKKALNKGNINMFLNVRTDTFLLGGSDAIMETKQRINLYERSGADGIFIPCIEREQDISAIVTSTRLPLNVMCMPNLPSFDRLNDLGVKRISIGNFVFDQMMSGFQQTLKNILKDQSFRAVF